VMKRLALLLKNWFDPVENSFDAAKKELTKRYRSVSSSRMVKGKGQGMRLIIPTDKIPAATEIKKAEEDLQKQTGYPTSIIMINPQEVKRFQFIWNVSIVPKEKRSSELNKILFGQMLQDGLAIGLSFSPDWIHERFAQTWDEDPGKMFVMGGPNEAPQPKIDDKKNQRVVSPKVSLPGGSVLKSEV